MTDPWTELFHMILTGKIESFTVEKTILPKSQDHRMTITLSTGQKAEFWYDEDVSAFLEKLDYDRS